MALRGFLSVQHVAGILVGDTQRHGLQRRGKAEARQELGHVAHFARELAALRRVPDWPRRKGACIP